MKEKKKETSLNLTGSVAANEIEKEMTPPDTSKDNDTIEDKIAELSGVDNDQVADIMEQILSLTQYEKEMMTVDLQPGYVLSDNKWLYSITRKAFFEVKKGSEIMSIEKIGDHKSHCLINSDVFEVSNDFIVCVGWN